MRKFIKSVLLIFSILSLLPVFFLNTNASSYNFELNLSKIGNQLILKYNVNDNPGISGLLVTISYNQNYLSLNGKINHNTEAFNNESFSIDENLEVSGKIKILYVIEPAKQNVDSYFIGNIFSIVFDIIQPSEQTLIKAEVEQLSHLDNGTPVSVNLGSASTIEKYFNLVSGKVVQKKENNDDDDDDRKEFDWKSFVTVIVIVGIVGIFSLAFFLPKLSKNKPKKRKRKGARR